MIFMQISTFSPDKNMPEPAYSEGQTPTTWQFRLQQASMITHTGYITSLCNLKIVLDRAYEDDDDNNNIFITDHLVVHLAVFPHLFKGNLKGHCNIESENDIVIMTVSTTQS